MNLDELNKHHSQNSTEQGEPIEADFIDDEEQAIIDIQEAITILAVVKTLLDYVGNPELTKRISKRERESMAVVSEKVRRFLATVEPTYLEEEGE